MMDIQRRTWYNELRHDIAPKRSGVRIISGMIAKQ